MRRISPFPACSVIAAGVFVLAALPTVSARAETYNYICKDQGRAFPLKVDDTRKILDWRGTTYRIKETEDCAKFGWRAEKDGGSFDFCTATQGYADFRQNGATVQCSLRRR